MKIQNTSIFVGSNNITENGVGMQDLEKKKGTSIYAGNLNRSLDPIEQKKLQAREQAMKIVGDVWEGEKKIDNDLKTRRAKIDELRKEMGKCRKEIKWYEEECVRLQECYGVAGDSKEQKDLELLEKEIDAKTPGKQVSLSKEEREQIARIKAEGLTEYQSRALEMKNLAADYEEQIYKIEKEIEVENAIISATKIERLKSNPMGTAQKQAESIMEAASEEIIGMVWKEGKEHVDESLEEKIEGAEKQKEEKELQEEKLEKMEDRKKAQEELTEEILDSTEQLIELDSKQTDVQREIKEFVDKMKLLEEDIKGAKIDEVV